MENNYDVVIVGSGIAGSIIAKVLTNAGKKVLMLEAGLSAGIAMDQDANYKNYQDYLNTFYNASAKVPNSPYPNIKDAPSIDVLDIQKIPKDRPSTKGYLVQMGPLPFASDNTRAPGGTTLHWLGTTLRMLPNDFVMKSKYGVGVDWPIKYDDMSRYYQMAENEIGVSGNVDDQHYPIEQKNIFGKDYVFPMKGIPTSYLDGVMKKVIDKNNSIKLNGKDYTLTCISTPQGRNSIPNLDYNIGGVEWNPGSKKLDIIKIQPGEYDPVGSNWDQYTGQRCEGNASCVPICPVQAKYNALKTFRKCDMGNLVVKTQAVASRLLINETSNWINGVEYKTYIKGSSSEYETHTAKGTLYVMACSAIENAKLLLASGAANSSDQVGRNLMDHMTVLRWGLSKDPIYPYRGPGSTSNIPTFRDGEFRKNHAAWILPLDNWGWAWPTGSPATDVINAVNEGIIGKELRDKIENLVTRQFFTHFECEQAPDPDNRVTIDPQYKDNIGNYRPVIHYKATEYMLKAFEASGIVSEQLFSQCDIEDFTSYNPASDADYVTYKGKGYTFAGAGHIVGTHRMGFSKEDSVVDANMRTWDHENLYLVGCGNMPTLGTSNPTLTMSALTFKAAEAILQQLEQ
ncbi:GMC family oxidoreductase [Flavobacterium panici]|uniref:Fructose dehydrogenase large subunit n=1 Tax=Flavobacterium panici TaxID=2654843 RepID=A0A9N8P1Q6_9FLAO|nr:GMC family oxidoreductase [Flavobacterium panici]CAC9974313.1 Fructose dehydrogenase large subunit [Flavobacterium panici]